MTVAILVPVLARPRNAAPLLEGLRATTEARVVFLVQKHDRRERMALERARFRYDNVDVVVVPFHHGHGDYARKINHGVDATTEEWLFQAADDLLFHQGWLEEALRMADETGRRVIGTNDMCNPRVMSGRHSTHTLVHRSYIEEVGTVDEPGRMLHEGYWHNFVDDELVVTAQYRREFVPAKQAYVQHLHPNCGKAEMDATYESGLNQARFTADRQLFQIRRARLMSIRPVAGRRAR